MVVRRRFLLYGLEGPSYSQIKAFYGLLILLPVCVFAAEGWDFLTRRRKALSGALSLGMGLWALTSFSAYWISTHSGLPDFLLGQELAIQGKHEKAVQRFSAALAADPTHLLAKSWLADSLAALGQ